MQIFEAPDPVAAWQDGLGANTGNPSEPVGRVVIRRGERSSGRRVRTKLEGREAFPSETASSIEQHIVERRPTESCAERAEQLDFLRPTLRLIRRRHRILDVGRAADVSGA